MIAYGNFSGAARVKWFTWPWYGAPEPCQKLVASVTHWYEVRRYDLQSPLQSLITFKIVGEAELVLFVGELEEIEEFGGGLVDSEWW